jgi:hypothetical protein
LVLVAIVAAIGGTALCRPALAKDSDVGAITDALRGSSVYVNPTARPTLSPGEAQRVRQEIAQRDPGRIKIAVVSESEAARAGGPTALANALDQRLGAPGTVLVDAGSRSWLVTAYADAHAAEAAVQQAFNAHRALVDQLLEAVDSIAAIDPGPAQSRGRSSPGKSTTTHVSSVVFIVIGATIALPFVIWGLALTRRRWRARAEARESLADDRADARDQLVALGNDIGDLDIDVSMPAADPSGKRDYERALEQYQRANRLLGEDATVRRVSQASAALADGRRLMDAARASLERPPSTPAGPTTPVISESDEMREQSDRARGRPES